MKTQEKQAILYNLQTVTGIFQEFEQAYNMVVSLPQQKQTVYNEVDIPNPIKAVASTGSSIVVTVIAYIVLIIPSLIAAVVLLTLVKLAQNTSVVLLVSVIINVIAAKYIGGFISRKIRAGGRKIQDTINQQIRDSNQAASSYNVDVDRQIAIAQQKCNMIRQQISQMDMSWYPPDYCYSVASAFFYKAINNGMCETLGEAVRLYDEKQYRDQVLANQQQQINLAYRQCILQGMTISAICSQGEATRRTIQAESEATRQTIQAESAATRGTIQDESAAARKQREDIYKDFRRRTGL